MSGMGLGCARAGTRALALAPLGAARTEARGPRAARPLEDAHLHRRPAMRSRRRTLGHRRPDQRRALHPLRREGSRADPRHVVILDNLGSHKGQAARRAIRAAGAHLLFLPPYSPDLNPIEQLFAKLKHLIRKAEPRTIEATWRKVGDLLDLFSPAECANYLKNVGYASV